MDSGSMEIKVMYCKAVNSFNFFQKLLVYVLVSIVRNDGDPDKKPLELQKQQRRTPTDKEAEGDPEWNHPMHFDLTEVSFQDCDNFFIHFDLCHEGLYFGDKTIGEVRVPLKDLIQEANGIVRFLSYEVRTPDGKPNGMLNFSCKVKNMGTNSSQTGITGYPIVNHQPYPTSEVQSLPEQVRYPTRGNWDSMAGQLPTFVDEEMRPNDFRLGRAHHPSFLNSSPYNNKPWHCLCFLIFIKTTSPVFSKAIQRRRGFAEEPVTLEDPDFQVKLGTTFI
ncbi:hypothetical protein SADUNF_Sadunf13G0086000 [Salix dunnii]|uniref:C2 domain-containing protein n=1 Tax=Salix dunnii TaxID=1413687 RepID=A0A835JJ13_9ROSI|nr:hypothetical protein SADUNF_Sadunf13G0086000 [Salix dunnii]